jgi:hypothetical protein
MFDNLRQQSLETTEDAPAAPVRRSSSKSFLGLTPPQRFVLAIMLFMYVTLLGCFALVVFGKVVLPFF